MKKNRWIKIFLGFAITFLCVFIMARQINLAEILHAFKYFEWPYLILGIASLAIGYMLRILRWSLMLNATGASATWENCAAPFLGSIALNNVLPLRLGDIIRAFVFPTAMRISRTAATSSILMERLIDLITLLSCLAISIVAIQKIFLPEFVAESTIAMTITGSLTMILVFLFSGKIGNIFHRLSHGEKNHFSHLCRIISKLLYNFEAISRPSTLFSVIGISMLIWIAESGLFYFILVGFGLNANPIIAMLVMAIATLSTLIPSSPGYVGPFHLAAFAAISMLGGSSAQAGGYAVLSHLALWLPTTVAGGIAIWLRPSLFRLAFAKPVSEINSHLSDNL